MCNQLESQGFYEWIKRRGLAEQILRGDKDIVEALREWQKDKERPTPRFQPKHPLKDFKRGDNDELGS
jgi:hypothetical protein